MSCCSNKRKKPLLNSAGFRISGGSCGIREISDVGRSDFGLLETSSSSSTESKPEPYAQNVATNFLTATHSTFGKLMRRFEWVNPNAKLYLSPQYTSVLSF